MISVRIGRNHKPGHYPQIRNLEFVIFRDGYKIGVLKNNHIAYYEDELILDADELAIVQNQIDELLQWARSEFFGI